MKDFVGFLMDAVTVIGALLLIAIFISVFIGLGLAMWGVLK